MAKINMGSYMGMPGSAEVFHRRILRTPLPPLPPEYLSIPTAQSPPAKRQPIAIMCHIVARITTQQHSRHVLHLFAIAAADLIAQHTADHRAGYLHSACTLTLPPWSRWRNLHVLAALSTAVHNVILEPAY